MRIGIIGPADDEISPFIERMANVEASTYAMLKIHVGTFNDIEVVALYCGVCKTNAAIAAQVIIDRYEVSHIFLVGVAGGIDSSLKIADTVIGTSFGYHDVKKHILTEYHPWIKDGYFYPTKEFDKIIDDIIKSQKYEDTIFKGRIVTGEAFISEDGREKIIDEHNPLCVDMETTSVAHVCYANNIPFFAIRSMTDTVDKPGIATFEENMESAARKSIDILIDILINL